MSWMTIEGEELVRLKRRVKETTGCKASRLTAATDETALLCKRFLVAA